MRDYQRQRVYDWEAKHIAPKIEDQISFETAVSIGHYVWEQLDLKYPPIFKPLPKQTTKYAGKANRTGVFLPDVTSTRTVLHELAHSLTCDHEGLSARHGPEFVGMYIKLLDKFTGLNQIELLTTLKMSKVDVNIWARPVFL